MARYETHRNDSNAQALIDYLEAHGASVARLNRPVDVAVGYQGVTVLCEIKTPRGAIRASQKAFLETFRGAARVIRSIEDCSALLADMRKRAA